jgi:hypothetical protein
MKDTPKSVVNKRQSTSAAAFDARSKRWTASAARREPNKSQNARRTYESIELSPVLKPKSAMQLVQRTTISTPNIIFGRSPQTEK